MSQELAYILITPYTIQKSRTGGVIARLLSRTKLDLVGARMLAPDEKFVNDYADCIRESASSDKKNIDGVLADYIKDNFMPFDGKYQRIMMLLFKGENARQIIYDVVGKIKPGIRTGETIRDTFSDYVLNHDGSVKYFEPAVIVSPVSDGWEKKLTLFSELMNSQPNVIAKPLQSGDVADKLSLVIIKPDNWRYPSSRPGNIIDMLSKTGLRIAGCKLYRMSVEEALEFYGPVKNVLRSKLAPIFGSKAKKILEKELGIVLNENTSSALSDTVGVEFADDQFSQIIEFMSGVRPEDCSKDQLSAPGKVKCLILIYQGEDAIDKIRDVIGPTDPSKAPGGTIRREFGTDVMVNTAHASDSYENAKREMGIVKIENNNIYDIIQKFYHL